MSKYYVNGSSVQEASKKLVQVNKTIDIQIDSLQSIVNNFGHDEYAMLQIRNSIKRSILEIVKFRESILLLNKTVEIIVNEYGQQEEKNFNNIQNFNISYKGQDIFDLEKMHTGRHNGVVIGSAPIPFWDKILISDLFGNLVDETLDRALGTIIDIAVGGSLGFFGPILQAGLDWSVNEMYGVNLSDYLLNLFSGEGVHLTDEFLWKLEGSYEYLGELFQNTYKSVSEEVGGFIDSTVDYLANTYENVTESVANWWNDLF